MNCMHKFSDVGHPSYSTLWKASRLTCQRGSNGGMERHSCCGRETATLVGQKADDVKNDVDPLERSDNSFKSKIPTRLIVTKGDGTDGRGKKPTDDEGQLSTNKFSRKVSKHTKLQIVDQDDKE
ncbi:hypothetical protein PIB30_105269 [Stylosanthes scabra]|uniref:Uncharacterized protein n=1 Tax=Stylosanthes scabra TaxID=79078 RepID=A0ABU6YZX1_9FABA|nr:hypothetical protein [Stylosanthes scabra]